MLVALLVVVLIGMVGLAIDGGRAYVDRREVQDAVDGAALAAGDTFNNTNSVASSETAAANNFAANLRIGGSISQSGWGSDNASATWSGYPGTFGVVVSHNAFNGTNFQVTATHQSPLVFLQAIGSAPTISIGAAAKTVVLSQAQTPALLTLGQNGCGTTGNSLVIQGTSTTAVVGALYSNGTIFSQAGAVGITVAGNAFSQCGGIPSTVNLICYNGATNPPSGVQPTSPGVCPPGTVLGVGATGLPLPDPAYSGPTSTVLNGLPIQNNPGTQVELQAGTYPSQFKLTSGCYFLDPGIYNFAGGFSQQGGLLSNSLRPPDEAAVNNNTTRTSPNLWLGGAQNLQHCDGAFRAEGVNATGGNSNAFTGTWGVVVTAVRTSDSYNGTAYYRESAPSMCRTVDLTSATKGFQVTISNVPGAQSYNVYGSPTGCGGPFGYVGNEPNQVVEMNTTTGGCPALPTSVAPTPAPATSTGSVAGCTLGYVITGPFDKSTIGSNFSVSSAYCTLGGPSLGCQYPFASPTNPAANDGGEQPPITTAGGAIPPLSAPLRDILADGGGDRANENECRPQASSNTTAAPCQGATVTPGGVQFYFPPSQCFTVTGPPGGAAGDLYIFGGIQYRGIALYAPAGNTCQLMKLAGGSSTTIIGTIYMPTAQFEIHGNSSTAVSGQVIVGQAIIDGTSGTAITYNPGLSPPAPGARLII
ncbi:MAG: hypothetical protein NVS9B1_17930 [Candidatus Dormibacteraceae bacterium]